MIFDLAVPNDETLWTGFVSLMSIEFVIQVFILFITFVVVGDVMSGWWFAYWVIDPGLNTLRLFRSPIWCRIKMTGTCQCTEIRI